MKYFTCCILLAALLVSCKNKSPKIVGKVYVDSLISHYTLPKAVEINDKDMQFWKSRIDPKNPRQVNESKYASTLVARFHFFGDINDVKHADSIYNQVNKTYNNTLAGPFVALTSTAMLQHHFSMADSLFEKAKKLGVDNFTLNTLTFDVNFELGRYNTAV